MKHIRRNALLAAGCLTLLAPMGAHAEELGDKTVNGVDSTTLTGDSTFKTIQVNDATDPITAGEYTIKATGGSLSVYEGSTGAVTLNDNSQIIFSEAVKNITFGSTQATGTNKITLNAVSGAEKGTVDLKDITIGGGSADASLELIDLSGTENRKLKADAIKLNASSHAAILTLENISASQYDSVGNNADTDKQTTKYYLKNSGLNDLTVNNEQTTNINATSGDSTFNNIEVKAGTYTPADGETSASTTYSKLNISANVDGEGTATLTQNEDKAVTLNNYTELNTSGNQQLTLEKVQIVNGATDVTVTNTNNNTNSQITTITIGNNTELTEDTSVTLDGVLASNMNTVGKGASTANLKGAQLGYVTVAQGTTENINNIGAVLDDASAISDITLDEGVQATTTDPVTAAQYTTLNVTANSETGLGVTDLNMQGTNKVYLNSADGKQGTLLFQNLNVTGDDNTITNSNINSATTLGTVNVGKNAGSTITTGSLTITANASGASTKLTSANVKGTADGEKISTLTLNADGGTITVDDNTTETTITPTQLQGFAKLDLIGSNNITFADGVTSTGTNNIIKNSTTAGTVDLGALDLKANSETTLENITTSNYTSRTIGDGATVNLANSALSDVVLSGDIYNLTVKSVEGSDSSSETKTSTIQSLNLNAGEAGEATPHYRDVKLGSQNGSTLTVTDGISMQGVNILTFLNTLDGTTADNGTINTGVITVTGTDNQIINNMSDGTLNISKLNLNPNASSEITPTKSMTIPELNLQGIDTVTVSSSDAGNLTVTTVNATGANNKIENNDADSTFGTVNVGNTADTVTTSGSLTIDAKANTSFTTANVLGKNADDTSTLTLNANGGTISSTSTTDALKLNGYANLTLTGANDITIAKGVTSTGTNNTIKIDTSATGTIALKDIVINASEANAGLTLQNVKSTNYDKITATTGEGKTSTITLNNSDLDVKATGLDVSQINTTGTGNTITNNTTSDFALKGLTVSGDLNVDADKGSITQASGSNTILTSGNLTLNGDEKIALNTITTSGTSSITNLTEGTGENASTIADLNLSDTTTLKNINVSTVTLNNESTTKLNDSTLGNLTITDTGTRTIRSIKDGESTTTSTVGTINAGTVGEEVQGLTSTINLVADDGTTLNAGKVTLGDNGKLDAQVNGTGQIHVSDVDVKGSTSTATSQIFKTAATENISLGTVSLLSNSILEISGFSETEITAINNSGGGTIKSVGAQTIEVASDGTGTYDSDGSATFNTAIVNAGSGSGKVTTLNLNADEGKSWTGGELQIKGNTQTNFTGAGNININKSGSEGKVTVTGTNNVLNNTNSNVVNANKLDLAADSAVSLQGTKGFTFTDTALNGASTVNNSNTDTVALGTVTFDSATDALTVNATAGTTTITDLVHGTYDTDKTANIDLTLNANGGNITESTKLNLIGGDKLNLSSTVQDSNISFTNGISATGTGATIKIDKRLGTINLGEVKIDASTAAADLTLENVLLDNYQKITSDSTNDATLNLKNAELAVRGTDTLTLSKVTATDTSNMILTSSTGTVNLGTLELTKDSSTKLVDVATGKYTSATIGDNVTVDLDNSTFKTNSDGSTTVAAGNELTLNAVAGEDATAENKTTSTVGAITLTTGIQPTEGETDYTTLNLSSEVNSILDVDSITMNGKNKVTYNSAGNINVTNGVTVNGTDNTITGSTSSSNVALNTITIDASENNADLTLENVKSTDYTSILANTGTNKTATLNLKGSELKVTGTDALALSKVTSTGTGNTISNSSTGTVNLGALELKVNSETTLQNITTSNYSSATIGDKATVKLNKSDIGAIDIVNGYDLTLESVAADGATAENKTTSSTGAITLTAGTPATTGETPTAADYTTLNLSSAENSVLNVASITMNGTNKVNYNSAGNINVTSGVTVKGTDNTIAGSTSSSNVALNTITIDASTADADLTLDSVKADDYTKITVNTGEGKTSTINLKGSELAVTGTNSLTVNKVTATGTGNTISNSSAGTVNLGTLELNADSETTLNNISNTNYNGITLNDKVKVVLNNSSFYTKQETSTSAYTTEIAKGNTLNVEISGSLPDTSVTTGTNYINASSVAEVNMAAGELVEGGTDKITTLNINNGTHSTTSFTNDTLTVNDINMNGNNAVNFTATTIQTGQIGVTNYTIDLSDINVSGTNNVITNNNDTPLAVDALNFTYGGSEVTLAGDKGFTFTNGVDVYEVSTINNNNSGTVNLGDITFNREDNFTLNANAGITNIDNLVKDTQTTSDAKIIATLNAAVGATINQTQTGGKLSLTANDSLTLSGNGKINITGGIELQDGVTLNTKDGVGVNQIAVADNASATISSQDGTTGEITIDELTLGDGASATWSLDLNETAKETDTLKLNDDFSDKLELSITKFNDASKGQANKYIKYVQLTDADTSIFNDVYTIDSEGNKKYVKEIETATTGQGKQSAYYSYTNEATDHGDYAANTIKVTNYNIADDNVLEKLTSQGTRTMDLSIGTNLVNNVPDDLLTAYPNMVVRDGTTNKYTINGTAVISSDLENPFPKAQIFLIDSTTNTVDGVDDKNVDREFTLGGASVINGLTDNTDETRMNTGNGAALHVNSSATTGRVTVNINPDEDTIASTSKDAFYNQYTQETSYDYVNRNTYNVTENEDGSLDVIKDVAFANNTAKGADSTAGNGGALYNSGVNSTITAKAYTNTGVEFNNNTASTGNGGAIYNTNEATFATSTDDVVLSSKTIKSTGALSFTGNTASKSGGAVYNDSTITVAGNLTATNNSTQTNDGGAIYNKGTLDLNGNTTTFTDNTSANVGGAIANESTLNVTGDLVATGNTSVSNGGAIHNKGTDAVLSLTGTNNTFSNNVAGSETSYAEGGAIYNQEATIVIGNEDLTSTTRFEGNKAYGNGGAQSSLKNDFTVYGDVSYVNNDASTSVGSDEKQILGKGGAIAAIGSDITLNGSQTFDGNSATGKGGAIYAAGSYTTDEQGVKTLDKATVINLTANKVSTFQNNVQDRVDDGDTYTGESNAIYFDGDATVNLATTGAGEYVFNDKIASNAETEKNVIKQDGNVRYNEDMSGYNGQFNLNSGNAYFTASNSVPFENADYRLNGGSTLHLDNGIVSNIHANTLDLSGTSASNPANVTIDMDLVNEVADRFTVANSTAGNINVSGINVLGETNKDEVFFPLIENAEELTEASQVNVESSVKTIRGSELYDYDVLGTSASSRFNGLLIRKIDTYDTGVQAPQVAINARLAGQLDLLDNVLHRVDEIAETRYFHKAQRSNLYAADPDVIDDSRIDHRYTPYVNQEDGGCAWIKPYATIEHNSPVGQSGYKNRNYNAFVGYETPVATLRNGWDLINTVFGGYQGSYQDYDNIQNYQNGGSGGYMANLYHNNFFAGGVVMMGGTNVDVKDDGKFARNMNFGLFDISGSVRAGYNVGLGKHWLLQPMLTASYIYITGINRHNERGEEVHLDGTNTFEIAPGFKLVGNYGGWQPYVLLDYTWPIGARTKGSVNDRELEDVGLRSYLEYGVGLRKNFGERFVGHLEAVMRNGGRTGVSFQGGLLFKF